MLILVFVGFLTKVKSNLVNRLSGLLLIVANCFFKSSLKMLLLLQINRREKKMPVRQLWFESRFEYNQTSFDVTINPKSITSLNFGIRLLLVLGFAAG